MLSEGNCEENCGENFRGHLALLALLLFPTLSGCDLKKDYSLGTKSETSSSSSGGSSTETPEDSDADGISNDLEESFSMEPRIADSDRDGFADGLEYVGDKGDPLNPDESPTSLNRPKTLGLTEVVISDPDTDLDGLGDAFETDKELDKENPDTDGDGFQDGLELVAGSDPFRSSSVPDRQEAPSSDGAINTGTPPVDSDDDGLSDSLDALNNTRSNLRDSDGDGFSDALEYLMGSDGSSSQEVPNFSVPIPPESTEDTSETETEDETESETEES